MRIGIDGYNLALANGTGIARYGYTLAETLKLAGHETIGVFAIDAGRDPATREILFFDRLGREPDASLARRRRHHRRIARIARWHFGARGADEIPLTDQVVKEPLAERMPAFDRLVSSPHLFEIAHRRFRATGRFTRIRMERPPDIMHWTYPVPVEMIGARNIYTLHDLVPLKLPYTTLDAKQVYRALVAGCIRRAAQLCTVSEASRRDIVAEFGVEESRITNSYQAAPLPAEFARRTTEEDAAVVEGVLGLAPRSYFLFFGAIEPKKNVGRLIEAYLSLGGDTRLVIVGGKGWRNEAELALLARAEDPGDAHGRELKRRIVRLDHLPRLLLLRLIRAARAVLFPSLYEGFGLPVLEAMQLGTPVLTSRASSLPEVAGNAAMLVDPYDTLAIAGAMRTLDEDAALRARLAAAGMIQARNFSRERYGERLDDLYARALARAT